MRLRTQPINTLDDNGKRNHLLSAITIVIALVTANVVAVKHSQAADPDQRGIEFAVVDERPLRLDLYFPKDRTKPVPLVIWVHGGAWRSGSREHVPIQNLTRLGYAIASVDYRLSGEAAFPAQVHDIKSAVRFLRHEHQRYGLDPGRFVIAGASAGGHLAALVGVTTGVADLEGDVGEHDESASNVHAIVSFYGASNLQTILTQSTPHGLSVRIPALQLLLRSQPKDAPELAKLASPVSHVDPDDPPLLLVHGDQDPQMPINQSHELSGFYRKQGLASEFDVIHGAAHGGQEFYEPRMLKRVARFLGEHLP